MTSMYKFKKIKIIFFLCVKKKMFVLFGSLCYLYSEVV